VSIRERWFSTPSGILRLERNDVRPSRTLRLVDVAELLGVTKQRVHQLSAESGFPVPVAEDVRGRLWDRRDVEAWAKEWRAAKPWR
jgi:predicted DNA-binding transcriptional regulator AlpA